MRNKKIITTIRKVGRAAKQVLSGLTLVVLIVGWLLISGLNLYCAISLSCNTASVTWWSLFLSVFGLPVLAVQIYLLRKTVEEGTWKPEISVGIFNTTPQPDEIMKMDELPDRLVIDYQNFSNNKRFIVRNNGTAAAKSVKIQIFLKQYPDQASVPYIKGVEKAKYLSGIPALVLENEQMIHPGDFHEIGFILHTDGTSKDHEMFQQVQAGWHYIVSKGTHARLRAARKDGTELKFPYVVGVKDSQVSEIATNFYRRLVTGKYVLEVKVWADGMRPVRKDLLLEVKDLPDEVKKVIMEIAEELKMYKETFGESLIPINGPRF